MPRSSRRQRPRGQRHRAAPEPAGAAAGAARIALRPGLRHGPGRGDRRRQRLARAAARRWSRTSPGSGSPRRRPRDPGRRATAAWRWRGRRSSPSPTATAGSTASWLADRPAAFRRRPGPRGPRRRHAADPRRSGRSDRGRGLRVRLRLPADALHLPAGLFGDRQHGGAPRGASTRSGRSPASASPRTATGASGRGPWASSPAGRPT